MKSTEFENELNVLKENNCITDFEMHYYLGYATIYIDKTPLKFVYNTLQKHLTFFKKLTTKHHFTVVNMDGIPTFKLYDLERNYILSAGTSFYLNFSKALNKESLVRFETIAESLNNKDYSKQFSEQQLANIKLMINLYELKKNILKT